MSDDKGSKSNEQQKPQKQRKAAKTAACPYGVKNLFITSKSEINQSSSSQPLGKKVMKITKKDTTIVPVQQQNKKIITQRLILDHLAAMGSKDQQGKAALGSLNQLQQLRQQHKNLKRQKANVLGPKGQKIAAPRQLNSKDAQGAQDRNIDNDTALDSSLGSNLGSFFDFASSEASSNETESAPESGLTYHDSDLNLPRVIGTRSALETGEVEILFRASPEGRLQKTDERAQLVAPDKRQSPISLSMRDPTYKTLNEPLKLNYPNKLENCKLSNTGIFWQVKLPYPLSMKCTLTGANLVPPSAFKLDNFHCHWGKRDESGGAEHTIDQRSYAGELHFVHYNLDKYLTIGRAAHSPDGMAVIAVFLDASRDYRVHTELDKIVSLLNDIRIKASVIDIKHPICLENLLPKNRSYWMYSGSLTTEPYYETVTWFVLKTPIKCNVSQIAKFRQLETGLSPGGAAIVQNRRPIQPLNGRTIMNFDEPITSAWWNF